MIEERCRVLTFLHPSLFIGHGYWACNFERIKNKRDFVRTVLGAQCQQCDVLKEFVSILLVLQLLTVACIF